MVNNGEETGPNEGYLFMNTSQPAFDSRSENVDLQHSPKVDQETTNSVKMHCIVDDSSPNSKDNQVDQPTNELSSPNYQNRPLNTCLDINDLPASHQSSSSSDASVTSTPKISAETSDVNLS